jgi:hypothetical protein
VVGQGIIGFARMNYNYKRIEKVRERYLQQQQEQKLSSTLYRKGNNSDLHLV